MLTLAKTTVLTNPKTERETVSYRLNYGGGRTEVLTITPRNASDSDSMMVPDSPEPGCTFYVTNAPEAYDGFGTKTIRPNVGKDRNGKFWRMIQVRDEHTNWQWGRNASGNNVTVELSDFYKNRELYAPEPKPQPEPVPNVPRNPVIVSHVGDTTKPATEPEPYVALSNYDVYMLKKTNAAREANRQSENEQRESDRIAFDSMDWTTNPGTWKPAAVLYYLEYVCGLTIQSDERTGTDLQNAENVARAESAYRQRNQQRASATVNRVLFLNSLKGSKKFGTRGINKTVCLSIGSGSVELVCVDTGSRFSQTVFGTFNVSGSAAVCVNETKLTEIFSKLKTDQIEIDVTTCAGLSEFRLTIRAGRNAFELPAQNIDDREAFAGDFPAEYCHQFAAGDLLRAIHRTAFATDNESSRYALGGICFNPNGSESFDLAATDSRRLSVQTIPATVCGALPDKPRGVVVPSRSVSLVADELKRVADSAVVSFAVCDVVTSRFELTPPAEPVVRTRTKPKPEPWTPPEPKNPNERNAQDSDGKWFLETFRTEFVFELPGSMSLRGVPIEGRFPRYTDVIPRTSNADYTFNRVELLNAFETVLLSTDDESRGVDVRFPLFEESETKIFATSSEFGSAVVVADTLHVRTFRTDNAPVTLDPKYLIDFLKRSEATTIVINVIDENTAIVINADDSPNGCYVVMPLSQDR
jgi:DNA polymerase III subunit beta